MKNLAYKKFSRKHHEANIRRGRPSLCQFELTFGCGLHCTHCYSDCFNAPGRIRRELKTDGVMKILDKLSRDGILWLCLTGGDPMSRPDFSEIYRYAIAKGFLVTVFTSGFRVTPAIATLFRRHKPFAVELTLNAADKNLYESVTAVRGSFARVLKGIDLLIKADVPLKLKAQITRQTVGGFDELKAFALDRGLRLEETCLIYPRLNGDAGPCRLRLPAKEIIGTKNTHPRNDCGLKRKYVSVRRRRPLFDCVVLAGDAFHIDPQGHVFLCPLIRHQQYNYGETDTTAILDRWRGVLSGLDFAGRSACRRCRQRDICSWCPGQAFLENGDATAPIAYYCRLAHLRGGHAHAF
jgi:radical SAM protein with 4Fe4S-binding SPASM domain